MVLAGLAVRSGGGEHLWNIKLRAYSSLLYVGIQKRAEIDNANSRFSMSTFPRSFMPSPPFLLKSHSFFNTYGSLFRKEQAIRLCLLVFMSACGVMSSSTSSTSAFSLDCATHAGKHGSPGSPASALSSRAGTLRLGYSIRSLISSF